MLNTLKLKHIIKIKNRHILKKLQIREGTCVKFKEYDK